MNRINAAWVVFASAASLFASATIQGTVQLPVESKPPASGGRYQIKASNPIGKPEPAHAIVYLDGDFPRTNAPAKVEVAQKHYQFAPGTIPVQKGAAVEFPNEDDDYHNVFSYSKPKRFDLGRYRKNEKPPAQIFDKPGLVKLYCEIHEHMRGALLVLDTPYYTRTETNGTYILKDLPAGKHTLKMWIDEKIVERPVELKDGETLTVDFK